MELIQKQVIPFNKQTMVDISLLVVMVRYLRQIQMETKNGIRTLVLAFVIPFSRPAIVAISLQVPIKALVTIQTSG